MQADGVIDLRAAEPMIIAQRSLISQHCLLESGIDPMWCARSYMKSLSVLQLLQPKTRLYRAG
jgi:hypothetical protein